MHYDISSTYKGYGHLSFLTLQIWDKKLTVITSLHLHMKNILPLIMTQKSPFLSQPEAQLLSLYTTPHFCTVSFNIVLPPLTLKLFEEKRIC